MKNEEYIIKLVNRALVDSNLEAVFCYETKMKLVKIISYCMEIAERRKIKEIYLEGLCRMYNNEKNMDEFLKWLEKELEN